MSRIFRAIDTGADWEFAREDGVPVLPSTFLRNQLAARISSLS